MSWDMWHVYGYGFHTEDIERDKMIQFVKNHRTTLVNAKYNMLGDIEDFIRDVEAGEETDEELCEYTDANSNSEIIALVIQQETGVQVDAFFRNNDDYHVEEAVAFSARYPWDFSDVEKTYTKEYLNGIFEKYIVELYGDETSIVPDYVDIPYWG